MGGSKTGTGPRGGLGVSLVAHAQQSVADVLIGRVEVPREIFEIGGFCGASFRALVNRLCRPPATAYLEVGVLHGATFCSALAGNTGLRACGVDNFSNPSFNGSEEIVRANLTKWQGANEVRFLNADAWGLDPLTLGGPFDVYLYDADHSEAGTARGITHFLPALARPFVLLMDDYERPEVAAGTERGIAEAGLRVLWDASFYPPVPPDGGGTWLNGLYLAVLE